MYNKTLWTNEIIGSSGSAASNLLGSIRNGDTFYNKVLSWADGRTDAVIAADLWARDSSIDTSAFPTVEALEVAIADVRSLAVTINAITSAVTQAQLDALEIFA